MSDPNEEADRDHPDRTLIEEFEYCAHCGAKLPNDVWCPISTERDASGTLSIRSFCDEACEDAWTGDATGER